MFEYTTQGTCSTNIYFDVKDNKVRDVSFENGCNGNLKGISTLVDGMDAEELIRQLKGIRCGFRKTSCPDQLARAVESVLQAR
ncbi:MAG: TIGR03905 family TSCPD domain-containing protein [Treponema sp.]|nr:TIGR03905 family TSCPD domain-containing protein [Treponema sp.]